MKMLMILSRDRSNHTIIYADKKIWKKKGEGGVDSEQTSEEGPETHSDQRRGDTCVRPPGEEATADLNAACLGPERSEVIE